MNLFKFLLHFACLYFILAFECQNPTNYSNKSSIYKSPINIPYYYQNSDVKYPGYPKISLNRTYYSLINGIKFEFFSNNTDEGCDITMFVPDDNINIAIINFKGKQYSFKLERIYLHVFSEHTFGNFKSDLEFQLIHSLDKSMSPEDVDELPEQIGIAILFSTIRDKRNKLTEQLVKENTDEMNETRRYNFTKVKDLDFNQYVNFDNPYYYYKGTSTAEFCFSKNDPNAKGDDHKSNCGKEVEWFIMKEVHDMKYEELRRIRLAMYNFYPNGNARENSTVTPEIQFHAHRDLD